MTSPHRVQLARCSAALGALAAFTFVVAASARLVKYGLATVELVAIGPGGVVGDAETHDVRLVDDGKSLTMTAGLGSLSSTIEAADKRLKTALETGKCPVALFSIPRSAIRLPTSDAQTSGSLRGSMQIHCQTREVTMNYTAKKNGEFIDTRGALRLDMREFGVHVPTYLGLRGQPFVTIRASFRARDL